MYNVIFSCLDGRRLHIPSKMIDNKYIIQKYIYIYNTKINNTVPPTWNLLILALFDIWKNTLWNLSNKFACDYFERPENYIKTKARGSSQTSLWSLLYKQHLSFCSAVFSCVVVKGRDTHAVTGFDSNSFTYKTPRLSFLFAFSSGDLLNV